MAARLLVLCIRRVEFARYNACTYSVLSETCVMLTARQKPRAGGFIPFERNCLDNIIQILRCHGRLPYRRLGGGVPQAWYLKEGIQKRIPQAFVGHTAILENFRLGPLASFAG